MGFRVSNSVKELSKFLPKEIKQKIFEQLLKKYGSEERIVKAIGHDSLEVEMWKNNVIIKEDFFPSILALALQESTETREIIRTQVLNELKELCLDLGVLEEENTDKVKEFLDLLDEESKKIVFYISKKGHARISELTMLLVKSNDILALSKIREVINPAAKKVFGKPFMIFKEAAIEPVTGRKILFDWWVEQEIQLLQNKEQGIFEVFDEKDFVRITAELPAMKEKDIEVEVGNENLIIHLKLLNGSFRKRIPIFFPVEKIVEKNYNNGVLEVKFSKKGEN